MLLLQSANNPGLAARTRPISVVERDPHVARALDTVNVILVAARPSVGAGPDPDAAPEAGAPIPTDCVMVNLRTALGARQRQLPRRSRRNARGRRRCPDAARASRRSGRAPTAASGSKSWNCEPRHVARHPRSARTSRRTELESRSTASVRRSWQRFQDHDRRRVRRGPRLRDGRVRAFCSTSVRTCGRSGARPDAATASCRTRGHRPEEQSTACIAALREARLLLMPGRRCIPGAALTRDEMSANPPSTKNVLRQVGDYLQQHGYDVAEVRAGGLEPPFRYSVKISAGTLLCATATSAP